MASFRVYFVTHEGERKSGTLMRSRDYFFDKPPPAAFGDSEEEVYAQLEALVVELEAEDAADLERYLWSEEFTMGRADVEVFPQSFIAQRSVIGSSRIPLRVSYAYSTLAAGGFRVMLPRFGWWFVVEELSIAGAVIRQSIASAMLGNEPRSVFDFRHVGREYVCAWQPAFLDRRIAAATTDADDDDTFPVLSKIAEEYVKKAEHGRLPLVVGHDQTFDDQSELLERDPPPSILLVGDAGVGKTTFVYRLAHYLLARKRGKLGPRRATRLWATSADRIIAGMLYLGMWQERCLEIIEELAHEGDYLYVDRLVDLMAPQSAGASIAELIAPAMQAREISLIAECNDSELTRCQQKSNAFVDAFHIIRIDELTTGPLLLLLESYQAKRRSPLTIHPDAYKRAVAHLGAFRRDIAFPGKAVSYFQWLNRDADPDSKAQVIYPRAMSAAFSRYSGLPVELIADDVPAGAALIASRLERRIIGQGPATRACARVLARFKAGLDDPERPVGTMFFAGPTGVGKTELAKQLAAYMFGDRHRMVRVDMSEYMTPGSSQRLLEVGRGVTSLAEQVRRQPLCVVLLDEIEKAHAEVFDLLLGILGAGRLTDSDGRLVDFRMALIVMTSNLGATKLRSTGFGSRDVQDYLQAVTCHFRPEFFNRLDYVISFGALSRDDVVAIVDLELADAGQRIGLARRALRLRASAAARTELARRGYHPERGARPLKRIIEEQVITPLAVRMAEEPAFSGRLVTVVTGADDPELAGLDESGRDGAISLPGVVKP